MNTKPAERSSPPPECTRQRESLLHMRKNPSQSPSEANVHTTVSTDCDSSPSNEHVASWRRPSPRGPTSMPRMHADSDNDSASSDSSDSDSTASDNSIDSPDGSDSAGSSDTDGSDDQ